MMQETNITAAAPAIGTPCYVRGEIGYVTAVERQTGAQSFTLGAGRMRPTTYELKVAFASRVSAVPDGIAAPWIAEAERMGLPLICEAEAADMLATAEAAQSARRAANMDAQRLEQERAAAFRLEAEAKIPAGAEAVIVAEFHRDDSDSMSDYFNHKTERVVILAWSMHGRDLFPELRKAARNFPETAQLADAPEKAEHREKYSMGGGYYLKDGFRHSTGWAVRKVRLYGHGAERVPVGEWSLPVEASPDPVLTSAPAAAGGFTISEHLHSKKGFRMWVATGPRVEREEYDRLLERAKALGGWYSRPWGGTPGGFAFKVEANARAFVGAEAEASPAATTEPRSVPAPKAATGDKLRALADGMQREIDSKLADRLTNTPKRQREAQSARLEGYRLQRTQQGLRALADLHDAGSVPDALRAITTKAAAYDLARGEIDSSGGYYDAGHETGKPGKDTPAALAFWALCAGRSEAERAADDLARKVEALQFANIPGYFPTPAPIVADMIAEADIPDGASVLEPEAGSGAILDAVREAVPGAELLAFERHASLRAILQAKGYTLTGADFMESEPGLSVDRVLMNPPFENGQDMAHVRRAFDHLKPGGRLVAIMSPGPFFRSDKAATAFRAWFDDLGGEKRDLPAGAFKASGTGVATVLVVIDR